MSDRVLGWVIGIVLVIVIGTLIYIHSLFNGEGGQLWIGHLYRKKGNNLCFF